MVTFEEAVLGKRRHHGRLRLVSQGVGSLVSSSSTTSSDAVVARFRVACVVVVARFSVDVASVACVVVDNVHCRLVVFSVVVVVARSIIVPLSSSWSPL